METLKYVKDINTKISNANEKIDSMEKQLNAIKDDPRYSEEEKAKLAKKLKSALENQKELIKSRNDLIIKAHKDLEKINPPKSKSKPVVAQVSKKQLEKEEIELQKTISEDKRVQQFNKSLANIDNRIDAKDKEIMESIKENYPKDEREKLKEQLQQLYNVKRSLEEDKQSRIATLRVEQYEKQKASEIPFATELPKKEGNPYSPDSRYLHYRQNSPEEFDKTTFKVVPLHHTEYSGQKFEKYNVRGSGAVATVGRDKKTNKWKIQNIMIPKELKPAKDTPKRIKHNKQYYNRLDTGVTEYNTKLVAHGYNVKGYKTKIEKIKSEDGQVMYGVYGKLKESHKFKQITKQEQLNKGFGVKDIDNEEYIQIAHISPKTAETIPEIATVSKNPKQDAQQIADIYRDHNYSARVLSHKLEKDQHYDVYVKKNE